MNKKFVLTAALVSLVSVSGFASETPCVGPEDFYCQSPQKCFDECSGHDAGDGANLELGVLLDDRCDEYSDDDCLTGGESSDYGEAWVCGGADDTDTMVGMVSAYDLHQEVDLPLPGSECEIAE